MPELGIAAGDEAALWYYNVTMAVGTGRPNTRVDVKMVQYFLMRLFQRWSNRRPAGPMIAVDGVFGPITRRYIHQFQHMIPSVLNDGVVDKALGEVSSISHTVYTIVTLNAVYNAQFGDLDEPWVQDQGMDSELAWAMYGISSQAPGDPI